MYIAVGFPSSAREDGAEVLYAGQDKGAMLKAIDAAIASKKFQLIGKLLRPLFQKHTMTPGVHVIVDCSPAHNAGLKAQSAALASGATAEEAASKGASVKLDAAKANALSLAKLAEDERGKFANLQREWQRQIAAAPGDNRLKVHIGHLETRAKNVVDSAITLATEAAERATAAEKDLAVKQKAAEDAKAAAEKAAAEKADAEKAQAEVESKGKKKK